jgi:hypothetical protein
LNATLLIHSKKTSMKASDINTVIENYEPEIIRKTLSQYENELKAYKWGFAERGRTIPIHMDEDETITITGKTITILANYYVGNFLSEIELNFLVDNILMSHAIFQNEDIQEMLEGLTDPEVNGHLTQDSVGNLIKQVEKYL